MSELALGDTGPILITGGTGFVGRSLVESLQRAGASLRVLSRKELPAGMTSARVRRAPGDLLDERAVHEALRDVSAVIHVAGARSGDAAALWRANVTACRLLTQAAKRAAVRRFIHVSSAGVYGHGHGDAFRENSPLTPEDPYGCSKLAGEQLVADTLAGSDVAYAVLRPYGVYGARRLDLFHEVRRRRVWLYGPSRVLVQPTHVDDVVDAITRALERVEQPAVRGQVFNVAGERAIEHFELVSLIAARLGLRARRVAAPTWLGSTLAQLAALGPAPLARLARQPLVSRTADLSKSSAVLGFRPLSLEAGIERTIRDARAAGSLR